MGSHCSSCWGEEDGVWSLVPMVATATADSPQTGLFKISFLLPHASFSSISLCLVTLRVCSGQTKPRSTA